MFGCGKMQMVEINARRGDGENTGNGNDFVHGLPGISEVTARDPFNVTHVCRQDESGRRAAGRRGGLGSSTLERALSREGRNGATVCLSGAGGGGMLLRLSIR